MPASNPQKINTIFIQTTNMSTGHLATYPGGGLDIVSTAAARGAYATASPISPYGDRVFVEVASITNQHKFSITDDVSGALLGTSSSTGSATPVVIPITFTTIPHTTGIRITIECLDPSCTVSKPYIRVPVDSVVPCNIVSTVCNGDGYRYGYNGQMKVNEIAGVGNHNTALYWEYDTRLGRRWNQDPEPKDDMSNYSVLSNNPITQTDPLGNTDDIVIKGEDNSSVTLTTDLINIQVHVTRLGLGFGGNYTLNGEEVVSAGLDIVGVVDPTGVADGLNAGLQAKSGDWLGAGISTLGIVPYIGDLAKVGKLGKDVKIIEKAIDGVKAVNGNSKLSTKAQHVYEIVETATKKVVKPGISGGKITKAEKSYRATKQVNTLNKAAGYTKYESNIVKHLPAGKGARAKALNTEKKLAKKHRATSDETIHKRP
jgi:hypothetical protein